MENPCEYQQLPQNMDSSDDSEADSLPIIGAYTNN